METHSKLENERSPFALISEMMSRTLEQEAIRERRAISQDITKVFKDIVQNFALMLDTEEKQRADSAVAKETQEQLQQ